ncbi:MAG: DUF2807 domain-containing protein [Dehalococcoidia bacterium]
MPPSPAAPLRTLAVAALAIVALLSTACIDSVITERGSGDLETHDYEVGEFGSIQAHRALRVVVTVDPGAEPSVTVTMDGNLFEFLDVHTSGDTLVLDADRNIDPDDDAVVEVVTTALGDIEVSGAVSLDVTGGVAGETVLLRASGASRIRIDAVEGGHVDIEASGASRVAVAGGAIEDLEADASGASSLDLEGVTVAGDANLDLSGASHADLRVAGNVEGDASGASSVTVHGDPESVDVSTSGASNVSIRR